MRQPIDAAQDFVIAPLTETVPLNPATEGRAGHLQRRARQPGEQVGVQYLNAAPKIKFAGLVPVLPSGNDGPVSAKRATVAALAQSGAIDVDLIA